MLLGQLLHRLLRMRLCAACCVAGCAMLLLLLCFCGTSQHLLANGAALGACTAAKRQQRFSHCSRGSCCRCRRIAAAAVSTEQQPRKKQTGYS